MEASPEQLRPQEGLDPESPPPQFHDTFGSGEAIESPTSPERRRSKEDPHTSPLWDAAKTKPSQFQKPRGSISATPSSRDGHVDRNHDRDKSFHDAHRTMFGAISEKAQKASEKIGSVLGSNRRKSSSVSADQKPKF